jgi:hypothetical protein
VAAAKGRPPRESARRVSSRDRWRYAKMAPDGDIKDANIKPGN